MQPKGQQDFRPYLSPETHMRELTPLPLIVGTLLGMVFGASSLYLVLKVGLTVSASIPVAVISITLFRILSKFGLRDATILQNNIVQTAGSAGESIAFGLGVTMPAIMILGFDLEITRVMLVAVLGGLLGILMMIPLRRVLIVQNHGELKYPEGTACAEVLKAGASTESKEAAGLVGEGTPSGTQGTEAYSGAGTIFGGFAIGVVYKTLMAAFKGWKDTPEKVFGAPFKTGSISGEISPELLGVGYIIGPRLSAIMCGGGVLAYLVLIPLIKYFGENLLDPLAPGRIPIKEMGPNAIRGAYVLYIGAGAVAAGGIISLLRSLPTIWHSLRQSLRDLSGAARTSTAGVPRTERDLSMKVVLIGILALVVVITLAPPLHMKLLGALLIVAFGFLFVTVSSRLTGEIGSTSNPISGMTVATLLLTCLIFLMLGWTGPHYYVTALSVGAIVCIASSNGGTTSQDLKTGFLIGGTPRSQQIAILFGALASALVLGPILLLLNNTGTVYLPATSLDPAPESTAQLAPAVVENLPTYTGAAKPAGAGELRLLSATNLAEGAANPLPPGDYLVTPSGRIVSTLKQNFSPDLTAQVSELTRRERLQGPQAADDHNEYFVWQKTNDTGGPRGRYLTDAQGRAAYFVDPGINGLQKVRPDGSRVNKYDAPKATLMSYIIQGILNRQLPWGLVLLGVMVAIVLEMAGAPSLAFAVGVYLPISSTTPIFVGGMIRWLTDHYLKRRHRNSNLSEAELTAEGDKSPGVLLASGYIAGGAIAGILIAIMEGLLTKTSRTLTDWSSQHNPFFSSESWNLVRGSDIYYADLLSLIPFVAICALLFLVGKRITASTLPPHAKGRH